MEYPEDIDFYSEEEPEYTEEEFSTEEEEPKYAKEVYETLGEEPEKYLQQYQKYWRSIYGIEPTLAERARLFREAELRRRGGPEKIREQRATEFAKRLPSLQEAAKKRAAERISRSYQKYRCSTPCENYTPEERRLSSPSEQIRLRVKDKHGKFHCVCYDIFKLYAYLIANYGNDKLFWRDPTYDTFSYKNNERIEKAWEKMDPCHGKFRVLKVEGTTSRQISIPRNLYDEITHLPNIKYLLFRISNKQGDYIYGVGETFHQTPGTIQLPTPLQEVLNVKPGDPIWLQDCFELKPIDFIRLQPLTEEWNTVPIEDLDQIKTNLTLTLENNYVVRIGDTITISYTLPSGQNPRLFVVDLRAQGKRVPVGITKDTEVNVDFNPFSPEGRIYW